MLKIGVLSSTRATDMIALLDAIKNREVDARVTVVISDKKSALALDNAKRHGIAAIAVSPADKSREDFDKEISEILDQHSVELVLMIGYMRIVSPWFVNRYKHRIMNIHPSLLPAFAGGMDKDVHKTVLDSGVKITGCTLHFVDESVDGGPIIMQKAVAIQESESVDTLKAKVQKAEQEIIITAVKLYSQGKLKVEGNKVVSAA
ncbi:MAG: phosphoribosylglycinamide formyltransferase 1 [archaeon GW2011_AR3]|nr:MAG: phosphoribosylglycinamide formyltransferase 1 [archaeon GW2011_AR3]MBS3109940.1 phosphoribosylglycinamide formyltransferase [Candidatus Woesearchaeota archaeon]